MASGGGGSGGGGGRGISPCGAEAAAAEEHISQERVDRRFADEAGEEELLDGLRIDRPEGRQAEEDLAEAGGLVRVLVADVLLQRALDLLLNAVDVASVGQAIDICKRGGMVDWEVGIRQISMRILLFRVAVKKEKVSV